MKYMGGKSKYAKDIIKAIFDCPKVYWEITNWVEPFCGACNIIPELPEYMIRYQNDINPYIIGMFMALQKGWKIPDRIDEECYKICKENAKLTFNPSLDELALIGFVGIACSYAGKWYGGYARGNDNKGNSRNYCLESKNNLLKQISRIKDFKDIVFSNKNYDEMFIPIQQSIIYCDPPYQGTTGYKNKFDHNKFWEWCNKKIEEGHKVFVSEYNAPEDWCCIWKKQVNNSLTKNTGSKKGIEKLFTKF
jgi:DNA adenine methylase